MNRTLLIAALVLGSLLLVTTPAQAQVPAITSITPQPVAGGTGATITVLGSNFGAAADTVFFPGNMPVSPTAWGPGSCTVPVPPTFSGTITVYSAASGLTSAAFPFELTYAYLGSKWIGMPTFYLNQNGAPGCTFADTENRFQKATWSWTCASEFSATYGGTTALLSIDHTDGQNTYGWLTTGFSSNPGLVASASTTYNPTTHAIIEADVTFNAQYFTWSCNGAANDMDVENVATHEFGHSIGFGDLYGAADQQKTMFGNTGDGETIRRSLTVTDVQGAEAIYPRAGRPNLTAGTPAGWYGPVVPSDFATATLGNVPLSPILTGNLSAYVSFAQTNDGLDCAAANGAVTLYLDNVAMGAATWAGVWATSHSTGWINRPSTVRSGRHTYSVLYDPNDDIVELNELDNGYDAQFSWSPYGLTDQFPVTRALPPESGLLPAPNCEGFQFTGNWWGGVAILARDTDDDYDLLLFNDYTGSTQGYQTPLASSAVGSGNADFVLVNGNLAGFGETRWAGVTRYLAPTQSDVVVQQSNQVGGPFILSDVYGSFNSTGVINVDADQIIKIHEVFLADTTLTYGFYLNRLSGSSELNLGLYPPDNAYMGRAAGVFGAGTGTSEVLLHKPATSGYYALVVFKAGSQDLPLTASYTVDMGVALSNLNASVVPAGFSAPAVPRNTADAGLSNALLPSTLNGPDVTTYLNWGVEQEGPSNVPSFATQIFVDEVLTITQIWPAVTEHAPGSWQGWNHPITVPGGRHGVTVIGDSGDNVLESNEGDNGWSGQWIWEPLVLAKGTPVARSAPPNTGLLPLPNADGMSFTRNPSFAWVIAAAPTDSTDDYDLIVYDDYSSSTLGFSNMIAQSVTGMLSTDFVVGHYSGSFVDLYPAVTRFSGGVLANFVVDASDANGRNAGDTAAFLSQVLGQDRLVDVYEANLVAGTSYDFKLTRTSGSTDLSLFVVTSFSAEAFGRYGGMAEGLTPSPTVDELTLIPSVSGWHPVVVVRPDGGVLDPATYDLRWWPSSQTGIRDGDSVPKTLALVGAFPNPSSGRSRIAFELPEAGNVVLEVFDVRGRKIRTLARAPYPSGRHLVDWDGRDAYGNEVPAGRYFAKLRAAGKSRAISLVILP